MNIAMRIFLFFLFSTLSIFAQTKNFDLSDYSLSENQSVQIQDSKRVNFSARVDSSSLKSDSTFLIEAKFDIPENTRIYSKDENSMGLATKIELTLPKNFKILEEVWDSPTQKVENGKTSYVYEKSAKVLFKIKIPQNFDGKSANVKIDASWLECSISCIPSSASLDLKIDFENLGDVSSALASLDASQTPQESCNFKALMFALFAAFFGGAILNLMPCVFPVIGLKILSFVKNSDGKSALKGAIFYSLGIILSFVLLGVLLVILKGFGKELGWGFQLQEPKFVAFLVLLFATMGLAFCGLFEIGAGLTSLENVKAKNPALSSFLSGILAVVVASPCTAPFMGSALGFALASNASMLSTILVFVSLGVGMALPYCLLASSPSLRQKMPKNGEWLVTFKQFLAFPMFATAIWLLGVFEKEVDFSGATWLLFAVLILSFGLWIFGKYARPAKSRKTRIFAKITLAIFLILSGIVAFRASEKISENEDLKWSPQKVEELRKSGKNVFVDFTASWCATCQTNKIMVLNTSKVREFFKENDVVILTADWTNQNPQIKRELQKFGRQGVPLNLLYPQNLEKEPIVLPTILTVNSIKDAVEKSVH